MFALHPPTGRGFLVLTLVLSSTTAFAQPPTVSLPDDIHTGDTVVISTLDGQSLRGRLASLSPAEITVLTRDGRRETLSAARVGRIVVKDPIRNGLIIGAGVGLAAGIAGAELVNTICENETRRLPFSLFHSRRHRGCRRCGDRRGIDGVRQRVALDLTPALPSEYLTRGVREYGRRPVRHARTPAAFLPEHRRFVADPPFVGACPRARCDAWPHSDESSCALREL